MEKPFGLHFNVIEDGRYIRIEASYGGRMVAGGNFTAQQVDEIIESFKEARSKMKDAL